MPSLIRTVEPTLEPVSFPEQVVHGRILDNDEGVLVQSYLTTARSRCENYLGQAFVNQTLQLTLERWPVWNVRNRIAAVELPRPPLQSITSIQYVDTGGTTQTLSASAYQVSTYHRPGRVAPAYNNTWPLIRYSLNPIIITYVAGYGGSDGTPNPTALASAAAVPEGIKNAIKIYAAHLYQVRDVNAEMPSTVKDLLDAFDFGVYISWFPDLLP